MKTVELTYNTRLGPITRMVEVPEKLYCRKDKGNHDIIFAALDSNEFENDPNDMYDYCELDLTEENKYYVAYFYERDQLDHDSRMAMKPEHQMISCFFFVKGLDDNKDVVWNLQNIDFTPQTPSIDTIIQQVKDSAEINDTLTEALINVLNSIKPQQ